MTPKKKKTNVAHFVRFSSAAELEADMKRVVKKAKEKGTTEIEYTQMDMDNYFSELFKRNRK